MSSRPGSTPSSFCHIRLVIFIHGVSVPSHREKEVGINDLKIPPTSKGLGSTELKKENIPVVKGWFSKLSYLVE